MAPPCRLPPPVDHERPPPSSPDHERGDSSTDVLWSPPPRGSDFLGRSPSPPSSGGRGSAVPAITTRDLPTPARPPTPPPPPTLAAAVARVAEIEEEEEVALSKDESRPHSVVPSLSDLLAEEEHELDVRRRRARRKRAADSASKLRRSRRLAAKELPFYEDVTTKAARVQAAKLDLARASTRMKAALESSGVLARPPPAKIASSKLRLLGRVCGLPVIDEVDEVVSSTA